MSWKKFRGTFFKGIKHMHKLSTKTGWATFWATFLNSSGHPDRRRENHKVARYFSVQHTKTGKNTPNKHKIHRMA
jgi:hypothetical protein